MKIFILEDDPERVSWIKENFDERIDLDITDQAEIGINLLRENEYDCIFLDHDLGGEQMVSSDVWNTGATVAKIIHETKNKDLTVIVHSYNPIGARTMIDSMKENGVKCAYCHFKGEQFLQVVKQINEQV